MATRLPLPFALLGALLLAGGCRKEESGPIRVSAIGGAPQLVNPNLRPPDAPSAFLLDSAAQGLVRFDAAGEIEPALAQRWTISNDGLHYTFRLARLNWPDGRPITADQVVARLRAAGAPASRNALKPIFGAIDDIEPMIAEVLEISLKSPRPNFLQLLAQPDMAIIRNGQGSGPFDFTRQPDGSVRLTPRKPRDAELDDEPPPLGPTIQLKGERAALAVARFEADEADLVLGGTLGDLPTARAAEPATNELIFDPVTGLLGLEFAHRNGPLADSELRQALSMSLDRAAIVRALAVPGLLPRESLVSPGISELPLPAFPAWSSDPQALRRLNAQRIVAAVGEPVTLRVAMPEGPGYRLLFAYLKHDWAAIGVTAERVRAGEPADLRLVDAVAPINLATWYLRHFTCEAGPVCSTEADSMLAAARIAPNAAARREQLIAADRQLTDITPFIPIATPVRWSLVSQRLNGFRSNAFGRHPAGELLRPAP